MFFGVKAGHSHYPYDNGSFVPCLENGHQRPAISDGAGVDWGDGGMREWQEMKKGRQNCAQKIIQMKNN